jgi:hypothetical protein
MCCSRSARHHIFCCWTSSGRSSQQQRRPHFRENISCSCCRRFTDWLACTFEACMQMVSMVQPVKSILPSEGPYRAICRRPREYGADSPRRAARRTLSAVARLRWRQPSTVCEQRMLPGQSHAAMLQCTVQMCTSLCANADCRTQLARSTNGASHMYDANKACCCRDRVDQKYSKIERGMDADIAAHDARMARTQQDVSHWKSNALQPTPLAAYGKLVVACKTGRRTACVGACHIANTISCYVHNRRP